MKIIIILSFLFFYTSCFATEMELVFSINGGNNNDILSKISIAVLKEAYKNAGIDIKVQVTPSFRSIGFANNGITDGEVNRIMGFEKKFTNLIPIAVPINFVEETVFTTNNINFKVKGWESLRPYHIGILRGIKSTKKLSNGMKRTFLTNLEQLFYMLERKRIDIGLTDKILGLEVINLKKIKNVRYLEPPIVTLNLYHYLHKKHKNIVKKITKVLQEMEKLGRIKQIRNELN